jgi:hypothetical protein
MVILKNRKRRNQMSETTAELCSQLCSLPQKDRADLAYFLLTSLEPEEEGVEAAWKTEVAK